MTLVEFLRARLDEDEQAARAALEDAPLPWKRNYGQDGDDRWMDIEAADGTAVAETESGANGPPLRVAEHIARHDPGRVMAEVGAKRRIIDLAEWHADRNAHVQAEGMVQIAGEAGQERVLERVLRLLALPYTDHPDYDEAWRP